jgi:hypothetical protein
LKQSNGQQNKLLVRFSYGRKNGESGDEQKEKSIYPIQSAAVRKFTGQTGREARAGPGGLSPRVFRAQLDGRSAVHWQIMRHLRWYPNAQFLRKNHL